MWEWRISSSAARYLAIFGLSAALLVVKVGSILEDDDQRGFEPMRPTFVKTASAEPIFCGLPTRGTRRNIADVYRFSKGNNSSRRWCLPDKYDDFELDAREGPSGVPDRMQGTARRSALTISPRG